MEEFKDEKHRIYFSRRCRFKINGQTYFLEGYINGNFEKYTNNYDYVNDTAEIMTAFSHYTYHKTEGKMMVCDLQGVNRLLTDPAILTPEQKFRENGDKGDHGINAFFMKHNCQNYCKALKLDRPKIPYKAPKLKKFLHFDPATPFKKCKFFICNQNAAASDLICEMCSANGIDLVSYLNY